MTINVVNTKLQWLWLRIMQLFQIHKALNLHLLYLEFITQKCRPGNSCMARFGGIIEENWPLLATQNLLFYFKATDLLLYFQ